MSNNGCQAITAARWLSIFMLAFLPWLTACADSTRPPKPPLSLPFAVDKAGSKVETGLRLIEERYYSFNLEFAVKQGDQADWDRVRKLVGYPGKDNYGKLIKPGVAIPVLLKISAIDVGKEMAVVEKEVSELELSAWGGERGFVKLIYGKKLPPGHYHVSIESLKNMPELDGTPVTFSIAFGHSK